MIFRFHVWVLLCCSFAVHAQPLNSDASVYRRAQLLAQNEFVEVYQDGITVDVRFIDLLTQGYHDVQKNLGRKFDLETLGKKIKVVVSSSVRVSHVWRGYEHKNDPRGIVFINNRAYTGFVNGTNATVLHELTHLLSWRFASHTLREGLAEYVARHLMPQAASGPNSDNAITPHASWRQSHLGSTLPTPTEVTTDIEFRKDYYLSSYYFVKFLIERKSLSDFLMLYDSNQPEPLYQTIYGISRARLVCEAKLVTDC